MKNSEEANLLCLTSIGNIKLKQKEMDDTKVSALFTLCKLCMYTIVYELTIVVLYSMDQFTFTFTSIKFLSLFLQKIIQEAEAQLASMDGVSPVHGRFYEMSSNYHKLMGNHAEYYRDALRYLGCTQLSDIASEFMAEKWNVCYQTLCFKNCLSFIESVTHFHKFKVMYVCTVMSQVESRKRGHSTLVWQLYLERESTILVNW